MGREKTRIFDVEIKDTRGRPTGFATFVRAKSEAEIRKNPKKFFKGKGKIGEITKTRRRFLPTEIRDRPKKRIISRRPIGFRF